MPAGFWISASSGGPCLEVKGPLCRPLVLGQSPQSQQPAASSSDGAVGGLQEGRSMEVDDGRGVGRWSG